MNFEKFEKFEKKFFLEQRESKKKNLESLKEEKEVLEKQLQGKKSSKEVNKKKKYIEDEIKVLEEEIEGLESMSQMMKEKLEEAKEKEKERDSEEQFEKEEKGERKREREKNKEKEEVEVEEEVAEKKREKKEKVEKKKKKKKEEKKNKKKKKLEKKKEEEGKFVSWDKKNNKWVIEEKILNEVNNRTEVKKVKEFFKEHKRIDWTEAVEIIQFLKTIGWLRFQSKDILAAFQTADDDTKNKFLIPASVENFKEIVRRWEKKLNSAASNISLNTLARMKREKGMTLVTALNKMEKIYRVVTEMEEISWNKIWRFIMSDDFLNGWQFLNATGFEKLMKVKEECKSPGDIADIWSSWVTEKKMKEEVDSKKEKDNYSNSKEKNRNTTIAAVSNRTNSESMGNKNTDYVQPAKEVEGQFKPNIDKQKDKICAYCKSMGHIRVYCPKLSIQSRKNLIQEFETKFKNKDEKEKINENKINKDIDVKKYSKKCLFVKGKLLRNNRAVVVALDTCSEVDAIRESFASGERKEKGKEIRIKGIGKEVEVKSEYAEVEWVIGENIKIKKKLVIMDDDSLPCDILLGFETMKELKVFEKEGVNICGEKIEILGDDINTDEKEEESEKSVSSVFVMLPMKEFIDKKIELEKFEKEELKEVLGDAIEIVDQNMNSRGDFGLSDKMDEEEEEKIKNGLDEIVKLSEFDEEGKKELRKILEKRKDAFTLELKEGGMTDTPTIGMEMNGKEVKHQKKREIFDKNKREWMQKRVELYRDSGIVREMSEEELSKCTAIANLIGVEVETGVEGKKKHRIVQDFRDLNEGVVKIKYNLQRPEMARMYQGDSRWFSTLDQIDAYFQYRLDRDAQVKTAFYGINDNKIYCWVGMPQGWCNSPAWLHINKDKLYAKFRKEELNYTFDDTLLSSQSQERHLKLIDEYLETVIKGREKLKPEKCKLGRRRVRYDGYVIKEGGWEKDREAVRAINNYPVPKNKNELKVFLGMMCRYEGFMVNYAAKAKPLYEYLKNNKVWSSETWKEIEEDCNVMKRELANETMLVVPNWEEPFHFFVDSGPKEGIGAVVGQIRNDKFWPIQFYSRRAKSSENKLWATEMELVGVKYALIEKGRRFTYGKTYVHLDAKSIKELDIGREKLNNSTRKKLVNDLLELRMLNDVIFVWHPRKEMEHVDALNRVAEEEEEDEFKEHRTIRRNCWMDIYEEKKKIINGEMQFKTMGFTVLSEATPGNIKEEQKLDPICKYIFLALNKRSLEEKENKTEEEYSKSLKMDVEMKKLWKEMPEAGRQRIRTYMDKDEKFEKFRIVNELLVYEEEEKKMAVVVPYVLKERILKAYHDSFLIGHRGRDAVLKVLKNHFYWIGRSKDVKEYVAACDECTKTKKLKPLYKGLKPIVKERAMAKVNLDFVGPLTETKEGFKYLLVMVCADSGSVKLAATKGKTSLEVANAFINRIICEGHLPSVIQTDNAMEFTQGLMKAINEVFAIKGVVGNPYSPKVNGIVERKNGTIGNFIRMFSNSAKDDWNELLPYIERTFEISINPSIGMTPYFYKYGYDPVDILFNAYAVKDIKDLGNKEQFEIWIDRLERIRNVAGQNVTEYQKKLKNQYDKYKKEIEFKEGDEVFAFYPRGKKLDRFWHGPYKIIRMDEDKRNVEVEHVDCIGDRQRFNVDRLILKKNIGKEMLNEEEMWKWRNMMKKKAIESKKDKEELRKERKQRKIISEDKDRYEVEFIVSHKDNQIKGRKKGELERWYLVRWKGYSSKSDTWQREEELLLDAGEAVMEYLEENEIDTHIKRKRRGN